MTAGIVDGLKTVPTVMDTLMSQKRLPAKVMSAFFAPNTNGQKAPRGTLVLGGTDKSLYTGSIVYAPQTTEGPAAQFWGAKVNKFVYGSKTISSGPTGIVDTGTSRSSSVCSTVCRRHHAPVASRRRLLELAEGDPGRLRRLQQRPHARPSRVVLQDAEPHALLEQQAGACASPRSLTGQFTFIPDAQLMPPATGAAFVGDCASDRLAVLIAQRPIIWSRLWQARAHLATASA